MPLHRQLQPRHACPFLKLTVMFAFFCRGVFITDSVLVDLGIHTFLLLGGQLGVGWRFGVAVTRWSRSTQLLYIKPG